MRAALLIALTAVSVQLTDERSAEAVQSDEADMLSAGFFKEVVALMALLARDHSGHGHTGYNQLQHSNKAFRDHYRRIGMHAGARALGS